MLGEKEEAPVWKTLLESTGNSFFPRDYHSKSQPRKTKTHRTIPWKSN